MSTLSSTPQRMESRLFYYFGSKRRLAAMYQRPVFDHIIEPFAGSAGYACAYPHLKVTLYEKDRRVVELWDELRSMSEDEIMAIPAPVVGERCTDLLALTRAASEHSMTSSYITATPRLVSRWPQLLDRLVDMVPRVQHWTIVNADYSCAPDIEATWFIDPPYQHKERGYAFRPEFDELASWCMARQGQVIVCEQLGATWLPFRPLIEIKGVNGKRTTEVVWTNSDELVKEMSS